MFLLLAPAFAASPFLNTAEAAAALKVATLQVGLTPPRFAEVTDSEAPEKDGAPGLERAGAACVDGTVHAVAMTEANWKDLTYSLANAWADCLLLQSYEARQLGEADYSNFRTQLTVSLLIQVKKNGRLPDDAIGGDDMLEGMANILSREPGDSEKVAEALRDLPELSISDSAAGTAYGYHGETWIFQTYPWSSWVYNFGAPKSPEEANRLVYLANRKLSDMRLWINEEGNLLLESPRVPSENPGDLRLRFEDFVEKATPLLPKLRAFVAGNAKADEVVGGLL